MQIQKGMIVKSIAGHDQNRFYCVVALSDEFAWIADGKRRKLSAPKKKRLKHLRLTSKVLSLSEGVTDLWLRRRLHVFNYPEEAKRNQANEGGTGSYGEG